MLLIRGQGVFSRSLHHHRLPGDGVESRVALRVKVLSSQMLFKLAHILFVLIMSIYENVSSENVPEQTNRWEGAEPGAGARPSYPEAQE